MPFETAYWRNAVAVDYRVAEARLVGRVELRGRRAGNPLGGEEVLEAAREYLGLRQLAAFERAPVISVNFGVSRKHRVRALAEAVVRKERTYSRLLGRAEVEQRAVHVP